MKLVIAGVAGAGAALIGAGVWALISKSTGYEVGIIAWAVGAFVGLAVFAASGRSGGVEFGVLAVVLAVSGIAAGKFAATYLVLQDFMNDEDLHISAIADELMYERARQNGGFYQPLYPTDDAHSWEDLYPTDVWRTAESRWDSLSEQQRENIRSAPALANEQIHLVYLADAIVGERMAAGETVVWPDGSSLDAAWQEPDYPAEIWAAATTRWQQMSTEQQVAYKQDIVDSEINTHAAYQRAASDGVLWDAFVASFGVFDVLWAGLAVFSAFRIGAAGTERSQQLA